MTSGASLWRETGDTDVSSFVKAISRSVAAGSSPMAADAASVHRVLSGFGLTRLGAAMAWHERKNDSWKPDYGLDSSHRNPWAMRCNDAAPACRNGWAVYATYIQAAEAWARRVLDPAGPYRATGTIAELIRVYAPASDGNDEAAYVAAVCREIDALPRVSGGGQGVANPYRVPAIYELYRDFAGFGLSRAQAVKIGNHKFPGRSGKRPLAIVLHIQEGTTMGSLNWWASGNADASSTVMVQRDGGLLRVIPEADGPWTNGDANKPSAKGQALITRSGGGNLNLVTLSIEMEGYSGERLAEGPLVTICWQVTEWMARYGLTLDDVYRHADINSVTRGNCPGVYWDQVMERLRGTPVVTWPGKPAWLADAMVTELFPEASPGGVRTRSWLDYARGMGRAPRRVKFHYVGTAQETIEFSDGLLIFRDGSTSDGQAIA